MLGTFVAHNILLDDGTLTIPQATQQIARDPRMLAARRFLSILYPEGLGKLRIADLGCLEGGFTVEFARMGFGEAVGIEVRASNFANCVFVKERLSLPNLVFINDDAWNLKKYGTFDVIFCCGLLYHLDRPKAFINLLSEATRRAAIFQTHFATIEPIPNYNLSEIETNEGIPGRWYKEPGIRSDRKRASWENARSFWIQKEYLIQAIRDAGFPMVFEQYDNLGKDIVKSMLSGRYKLNNRSMFVGVKDW